MIWSSRVIRTVKLPRAIGLQARVKVESTKVNHFFTYLINYKMVPTSYKVVLNVVSELLFTRLLKSKDLVKAVFLSFHIIFVLHSESVLQA